MRISIPVIFDAARTRSEAGFTLVELMVVIAIIGLVSAAAVLAMPDPRGRVIEDADRFAGRVSSARDQAIVQGRPMAVWIAASGYGFRTRRGGGWTGLEDRPFSTTQWREGTVAVIGPAAESQIAFDTIGLPSAPLSIKLVREGAQAVVSIDMAGRVTVGG